MSKNTKNRTPRIWLALFILFAINTVNFYDRLIIGAVGEPIRVEFGLGDAALGLLSTAFTLLYAFVGVPLGRLADKVSRKKILSAGVFAWSLLTAGSGIAQNFWQVFLFRLGVGVGEASCAPAAASLISDLFPQEKRARALSIFMLGLPLGIALSFAVSGTIAGLYGWRAAFFIAAIPGILLSAAALFIHEPEREKSDTLSEKPFLGKSPYRRVLALPAMRWLILSGALHNFSLYALSSFITPLLMRRHGLDIRDANLAAMIINGIMTLPGLLLGGILGDAAKLRRPDGGLLLVAAASLLSAPFFVSAMYVPAGEINLFLLFMGGGFALMYFYYAIVYSTIQDIAEPRQRGTAMSIYFMAMYLVGGALGPYVVGTLSDYFTRQAAQSAGIIELSAEALEPFRASGLTAAIFIVPILSVFLSAVMFAAARSLKTGAKMERE